MDPEYWVERWNNEQTGWHSSRVYPPLKTYWNRLMLEPGARVFVPLCGKSTDMLWLARRGYRVVGNELSEKAVTEFFRQNNLQFETEERDSFTLYRSQRIRIWQGNFFKLNPARFEPFDGILDKAGLIALSPSQRKRYSDLILALFDEKTEMLLNSFEYKQEEMEGPPYAVFKEELNELYGDRFRISLLHEESVLDDHPSFKKRGLTSYLKEKIYHLQQKTGKTSKRL